MKITTDVVSKDKLSCTTYSFYVSVDALKPTFFFNSYEEKTRPSTRHKFRVTGGLWNRLLKRKCNIEKPSEVPQQVMDEVKQKFMDSITFSI